MLTGFEYCSRIGILDYSRCCVLVEGGGERSDPGYPVHLQCTPRLSRLLAHLQHHGRQSIQWQVRTLR